MNGCKHWVCSKTIRWSVLALVMLVIAVVGMWQKLDVKEIVYLLTAIGGVLGAMYGRAVATDRLSRRSSSHAA